MYWCVKEGALPPGYTPEEDWADYAGVWHFTETIGGSESEAVPSTDATGNSNFAWPVNYNAGSSIARMRSSAGLLGNARQIETGQAIGGGCHLVVSNSASLNFGGKFTVSGWMKLENYPSTTAIGKGKVWPFAAREGETAAETGYGAFIARSSNANSDLRSIMIYGAGCISESRTMVIGYMPEVRNKTEILFTEIQYYQLLKLQITHLTSHSETYLEQILHTRLFAVRLTNTASQNCRVAKNGLRLNIRPLMMNCSAPTPSS